MLLVCDLPCCAHNTTTTTPTVLATSEEDSRNNVISVVEHIISFFLRPAPQWADFRTPLPGYYFGAAGAHPGGGVMGAAGKLAATEILKDWR